MATTKRTLVYPICPKCGSDSHCFPLPDPTAIVSTISEHNSAKETPTAKVVSYTRKQSQKGFRLKVYDRSPMLHRFVPSSSFTSRVFKSEKFEYLDTN